MSDPDEKQPIRPVNHEPTIDLKMTASNPKSLPAIGFLTILEHTEHGLFGGYLVLNIAARPLEFHCTAPIKANRAQQILYGPTLKPYLYGEQIGQTLLLQARIKPLIVCTDTPDALAVRDYVSLPVVLISPLDQPPEQGSANRGGSATLRLDQAHATEPAGLVRFQIGPHQLAVPSAHEGDRVLVRSLWRPYAHSLDLAEPFDRIRQAIEEARREVGAKG